MTPSDRKVASRALRHWQVSNLTSICYTGPPNCGSDLWGGNPRNIGGSFGFGV